MRTGPASGAKTHQRGQQLAAEAGGCVIDDEEIGTERLGGVEEDALADVPDIFERDRERAAGVGAVRVLGDGREFDVVEVGGQVETMGGR